ncbi:MAG: CapA family protein [Actinomycetota bacterium]|nr:CapA family protein [Actinomycetota bacterium]
MLLALAGDTMLGRGVAELLRREPARRLFAEEVAEITRGADLFVLNLECCISERGERFPDPDKPFFFRAPPAAADTLAALGVDCVTLANNHALDYGPFALLDTLGYLDEADIAWVGAGPDVATARASLVLEGAGMRLRVTGVTDHPAAYAATSTRPGVAYADLRREGLPDWLREAARPGGDADATLVTPHWGPNMHGAPVPHVLAAADALVDAGATLVAGHSAHVFQGVAPPVLYDLGDFIDDYRVDDTLRNDLGLLFLVEIDTEVRSIEAVPLRLDYAHTRIAPAEDAEAIERRFAERCASEGTSVQADGRRLVVTGS